jgi:deoxyadenosine/deoxycytidine kinase
MKIALCGTTCAGKTTLAEAFSDKHDIHMIRETAEQVIEKRMTFAGQLAIASLLAYEMEKHDDYISDRSLFDCYIYNEIYELDDQLSDFIFDMATESYENIDLFVFVDEYFPLEDNGIREMDVDTQKLVFSKLRFMMEKMKFYNNDKILFVTGTTEERIGQIEEKINE